MAEFSKALQLIGLLFLVGAPGFWLLLWRPTRDHLADGEESVDATGARLRQRLRVAVLAGAAAAILGAGLDVWRCVAPLTVGLTMPERVELAGSFLWDTRLGQSRLLAAVAAFTAAPIVLWLLGRDNRTGRNAGLYLAEAAVLASGLVMGWAATAVSHAATSSVPSVTVIVDSLHLAAFIAWSGVLFGLSLIDWRQPPTGTRRATRWLCFLLGRSSAAALASVTTLILAGACLAFVLALYMSASTVAVQNALAVDYGRLIFAKGVLLSAALTLAAVNRFAVLGRLRAVVDRTTASEPAEFARIFGRLVRIEALLVLAVVATTAMLVHAAPP
jgi:putative copper export protein